MRSGHSLYSNSQHGGANSSQYGGNSQYGGSDYYGGSSEVGSSFSKASTGGVGVGVGPAGTRRTASWSTRTRAHPLPRSFKVAENEHGGGGGGGYYGSYDDNGDRGVGALGGAGNNRRRRRTAAAATATAVDGSMSDVGTRGRNNNNPRSGSRAILRSMSMRGRSFFVGGGDGGVGGSAAGKAAGGLGERRSVSMSAVGGRRAESAHSSGGGDYDHWGRGAGGGGRGVANRVCSALSVSWLFSSKGSSKKDATTAAAGAAAALRRRGGGTSRSGSSRSRAGGADSASRRTTAFTGAGVIGIVDAHAGEYTSSDDADYDGDVFEIGGPLDIAVGGGGGGAGRWSGHVPGGSGFRMDEYGGGGGGGSSLPSADGGETPVSSSRGTGAGAGAGAGGSVGHGKKSRMGFTLSAFPGFNRSAKGWVLRRQREERSY